MSKFILAKKQKMTQCFDEEGRCYPATLVVVDGEHELKEGDKVKVSGISKGKGFQGVVKRHGFHGGPRTHGQKHSEREGGSIGATGPQRVFKGQKMPGRMGSDRITVKNLKILKIDKNEMLISGAIPGRKDTKLEIYGI